MNDCNTKNQIKHKQNKTRDYKTVNKEWFIFKFNWVHVYDNLHVLKVKMHLNLETQTAQPESSSTSVCRIEVNILKAKVSGNG